jgi:hypothetical protein
MVKGKVMKKCLMQVLVGFINLKIKFSCVMLKLLVGAANANKDAAYG